MSYSTQCDIEGLLMQPKREASKLGAILSVVAVAFTIGVGAAVVTAPSAPAATTVLHTQPVVRPVEVVPARSMDARPVQHTMDLELIGEEENQYATVPRAVPASLAAMAATPLMAQAAPLEFLGAEGTPINSYMNFWVPLVEGVLGGQGALIHWLHPVNMGVVLVAMGGYGSYLGWGIRKARADGTAAPEGLAGASHPLLMSLMFLFFLLGAQGGLLFTIIEGRDLFASNHSVTGTAGLALLAAQAYLGRTMKEEESKRTVHAYLGSAIMALFAIHAALGLQLALSTA